MADSLSARLRTLACSPGLPWTADNPEEDHGHTDCWVLHLAANRLDRLTPPDGHVAVLLPRDVAERWMCSNWREWGDVLERATAEACFRALDAEARDQEVGPEVFGDACPECASVSPTNRQGPHLADSDTTEHDLCLNEWHDDVND